MKIPSVLFQKSKPFSLAVVVAFLLVAGAQVSTLLADNLTGFTGSFNPVDNRQPTLAIRYIIATQGIFPSDDPQSQPNQPTAYQRTEPFLGEIKAVAFNFAPKGWMLCEGQLLAINQNQALFSLLQTRYGGNGQTNFALPDLRNRTPIGAGQGPGLPNYLLGEQSGNAAPILTVAQLPVHSHSLPSGYTGLAGNGDLFDNRQASVALNFLIAANGEIMIVAWPYQPSGWATCDGRLLSAASNSQLYGLIGTTYGGDSTNFALPDFRGRAIVGDDGGISWPRGLAFGSNDTFLTIGDMPAHTHTITGGNTGSTGGSGETANNYQPSLVVRWIISFFGIFPSQDSSGHPMVGELRLIGGASATGLSAGAWEPLDGSLYDIGDNETLFNLIGTTYGGDGQNTFGVPDLQGRVSVSSFAGDGLPFAAKVGSPTLNIGLSELASHAHLVDLAITGIEHLGDGSANISLKGMVGSTIKVDLSDDDGITWSPLAKLTLSSSPITVNDPNTAGSTKRFYRAR